jgi:hypothetical protein
MLEESLPPWALVSAREKIFMVQNKMSLPPLLLLSLKVSFYEATRVLLSV